MPLDTTPGEQPELGRVREDDLRTPRTPRPPGVIALRIVIALLLLIALTQALDFLSALTAGTIDIGGLLMLALSLVGGLGLLLRVEPGRLAAITYLYLALLVQFIALFLVLVQVLRVIAGKTGATQAPASAWLATFGVFLLIFALHIWMLTVLHSRKTIALMQRSVAVADPPDPQQATPAD